MTAIIKLILLLIVAVPRHPLNKDPILRAEVAGYYKSAGEKYDLDPTLLVYWTYKESSLRPDVTGKLGEVGVGQFHGVARRSCEASGYDVTTYRGGIFCTAMLIDDSRRFCGGDLERGLVRYASGSCRGTEKTRKKIRARLKAWRKYNGDSRTKKTGTDSLGERTK